MISPGTIRAASLVSKGVSPESALRTANTIDIYTENRRSFLASNPATTAQLAPSTSINGASVTTIPSPMAKGVSLGNINSSLSNVAIKPAKDFTKEESDAITKLAASVENPIKKKAIVFGDPTALIDDQATSAGLAKLSPKQLGQLGANLQSTLHQNYIDNLPTSSSKLNFVPDQFKNKNYEKELIKSLDKLYIDYNSGLMDSPTVAGLMKAEHTKRLSSYQGLVKGFTNSKDFDTLSKSYEGLVSELDLQDKTATSEFQNAERQYNRGKSNFKETSLTVGQGAQDYQKNKNKYNALKQELANVYNKRANAMLANEVLDVIDSRYKEASKTNPQLSKEKFFEQQQKQYSLDKTAFGLGQMLVESGRFESYQDYIRFTNPTKYSKKSTGTEREQGFTFTVEDPFVKNNTEALDLSRSYDGMSNVKGYDQTRDRESGNYRYNDTKDDIIFSGIKFAQSISEELDSRTIKSIKERESLKLNYNKKEMLGTSTKQDKQQYESRLAELDSQVEYSDSLSKTIPEVYKYENIKKNQLVKSFAEDRRLFLDEQKRWNDLKNAPVQTAWYSDLGLEVREMFSYENLTAGRFGTFGKTQTGAYFQEAGSRLWGKAIGMGVDIAKFTDQTLLNETLGVPKSANYNDRNQFYNYMRQRLDVPEVIDERASLMAGKTIRSTTIFYTDPAASWYNPTGWNFSWKGALMTGVETLPQLYAFSGAGRITQGLGGGVLKAGLTSGITTSLLGEANAARFALALQTTGSTASAWANTFRNSNNVFLKEALADRIPSALGMATVMYPEQYNRTLERLEMQGVKNARSVARNVALLSTGIELIAENIIPNIRYLDDFAEKGTGFKSLLGKAGAKSWLGNFDQYRALYSGVLGDKFSEKSINYLARNSAELFGKVGAAGRFYASRGTEEGIEEVFSELVNGVIDAKTSYANYRQEAPNELSFDSIVNAFAGGFFVPSAGASNQMKIYGENKKYSAMYDMMINSDYYKNKINTAFKAGEINQEQATNMLSRVQDLVAVADDFGVQNLKSKADAAQFTADLVNDEDKQFDYFKQVLKVRGIEERLGKDSATLKDEERTALLAESEEATKRIGNYKRQVSVFENMSDDQKTQIVNNTIAAKVQTAKFSSTTQILSESIENADNQLARAIQQKAPETRISALKEYRNALIQTSEDRASAKQVALDRGTYNPVINAVTSAGEAAPLDLSEIKTGEDAVDVVVQSMLDPENGMDMYYHITGQTQQSLEQVKQDKENLVDNFLDYLEHTEAGATVDNSKESTTTTADTAAERIKYRTISDLNDSQKEMFEDLAERLDDELGDLQTKVDKYDSVLTQVLQHGAINANMSTEQQEKFSDLIFKKFAAVKKVGFKTSQDRGSELFDLQEFGLYLGRNQKEIEKASNEIDAAVKKEENAQQVQREEVSLDGLENIDAVAEVTVPELIPEDITDSFTSNLSLLESIVEQQQVEVVENQVTGEVDTLVDLPKERSRVISALITEMAMNPDIKGAQAMMAAVMQVLGKSNQEIAKTLSQMSEIAENKPVNESDYTHMFNLYQLARMTENVPASTEAIENAAEDLGAVETPVVEAIIEPVVEVIPAPVVTPPVTENQKDELADKTQISSTTPMFRPISKKDLINLVNYEIQEAIIFGLNKEIRDKKDVNTAIVDLFTTIDEVLGEETLTALEKVFDEAVSLAVGEQRLQELRVEFMSLFPKGFLRQSALDYMFDQIIVNKVAQSDVTEKGKEKLDATDEELIAINKNRAVSIEMADGRKFAKVKVVSRDGILLYAVEGGKEDGKTLWLKVDRTKDKIIGLKYPILGTRSIQFTDLNALLFTVLDSNGKVQKYGDDGNKNESGDKSLVFYLPTSKYKAEPTETQKQFNVLRQKIVSGDRVKVSAPVKGMSVSKGVATIEQPDGSTITKNTDYALEFSTENLSVKEQTPNEATQFAQAKEAKVISETIPPTQATTIAAVEKMIADSKKIPDPSKQGYLINGKRYERQSNFVKRALGEVNVVTEDSIVNMEMGAAVGNLLDIIGRDVLGGNKVNSLKQYIAEAERMGKSLKGGTGYKINFTQEQFDQLVAELTEVKDELNSQGWKLFTEGLIVHREFTEKEKEETGYEGVAGAMDILAVDPEGKVHIIDFKNKKYRTQDKFTSTLYSSKGGFPSNVSKWSIQQTTYAILGEDFGLPVDSISILAFASEYGESSVPNTFNQTRVPQTPGVQNNPKSIGANTNVVVADDVLDKPDAFNEWINHDVTDIDGDQLAIHKETDDIYKFGQELDANNSEWSIGSFRAEIDRRLIVDVFANGKRFLVYRSIGEGTGAESKGEWTPLFGFAESGWFIKTMWKGKNPKFTKYESKTFLAMHNYLNENEEALFAKPGVITIKGLTLASNKAPITDKHKSAVSNNLIKLGFDSKIIKHIKLRTEKPSNRAAVESTTAQPTTTDQQSLDKLQENLPQIAAENAENVFDVLNLLGIEMDTLGVILPTEGSTDPDALNPPKC